MIYVSNFRVLLQENSLLGESAIRCVFLMCIGGLWLPLVVYTLALLAPGRSILLPQEDLAIAKLKMDGL